MENLRDFSVIWSLVHILLIFMLLSRSRYSLRVTVSLTLCFMGCLILANAFLLKAIKIDGMGRIFVLTCTVPTLLFYYWISYDRGWKFCFTFCLADTCALWLCITTNLLDLLLHGQFYILFITRMIAFPLAEYVAFRYLRRPYQNLQKTVSRGWAIFTLMAILYYALLCIMPNWPNPIINRPADIPALILVLAAMPATYLTIFSTLHSQLLLFERSQKARQLQMQKEAAEQQLENQQALRQLQHDMKAHLIVLNGLLSEARVEEAQAYLQEINAYAMDERKKEFCADPYLNAVLQQYSDRFLKLGAQWEYVLKYQSFPLTHAETCLIFSNALENCCDALQALPPALREVSVQTDIQQNYALIRIKNRCGQKLQLTPHQLPPSCKKDSGHGLGLTTIQDIAQRQGGNIHCSVENGWFILDVMLKLEPVCDPQASADTTLA